MGDPDLGIRIRDARNALGLTQQEFAKLVGWKDSQSVSNAERGITGVPPDRIRAISIATGRPISYFMDSQSEPAPDEAARTALLGEVGASVAVVAESLGELVRLTRSMDERLAQIEALVDSGVAAVRRQSTAPGR